MDFSNIIRKILPVCVVEYETVNDTVRLHFFYT